MVVLDYKDGGLLAKKREVDWVCASGFLVEHALHCSASVGGPTAVQPKDLPETQWMTLDGYSGEREVLMHPEDRVTACHLARGLREKEHDAGLAQTGARVPVMKGKKRESDHDQVLEVIKGPPIGNISCEVRLRTVNNDKHRFFIRKKLQQEADTVWWKEQKEVKLGDGRPVWGARLVVLVEVYSGEGAQRITRTSGVTCRADILLNRPGAKWEPLWGWDGSRRLAAICAPAPNKPPPEASRPQARPRMPKLTWEQVDQKQTYWEQGGVKVASIPKLLGIMKVDKKHYGRDMVRWIYKHGWTKRQVQWAKRKGGKVGGDSERVATQDVLHQIFNYYCFKMPA